MNQLRTAHYPVGFGNFTAVLSDLDNLGNFALVVAPFTTALIRYANFSVNNSMLSATTPTYGSSTSN